MDNFVPEWWSEVEGQERGIECTTTILTPVVAVVTALTSGVVVVV